MRWFINQWRNHTCRTALACLLGLIVLAFIFHEPILMRVGNYLLVSDAPVKVDVIRVLGGNPARYVYGADLYKRGYGDKLIFSLWDNYMPLLQRSETEIISEYSAAEGIPVDAVSFWEGALSTYHEAEMTRDYVLRENVSSVMVVSSPYHMRRASMVFDQLVGDLAEIYYVPVPLSWTDYSTDWWRNEDASAAVLHEYVAMIYYFFKYRQ